MKKTLIVLSALVLLMTFVVGCGGSSEDKDVTGIYRINMFLTLELGTNGDYEFSVASPGEDEPETYKGEYQVEGDTVFLGGVEGGTGKFLGERTMKLEGDNLIDEDGNKWVKQ